STLGRVTNGIVVSTDSGEIITILNAGLVGQQIVRNSLGDPLGEFVSGSFNSRQDNRADLAVFDVVSQSLRILEGDGNGAFQIVNGAGLPVASLDVRLATGDFNADGITDLAVSDADAKVRMYGGSGDGTFSTLKTLPTPAVSPFPAAIAAADIDGLGRSD